MYTHVSQFQRGQAIVETVLFLPLFLLALFGMIWAVQVAVQYERVESAVRYAGLVSNQSQPYLDYSLYAMYVQLGVVALPQTNTHCNMPSTAALTDAAPTYKSTSGPTASGTFWQSVATPKCPSAGLIGSAAGSTFNQDVIFSQQQPGMLSALSVPPIMRAALGASTTVEADARFFKPISVGTILACYPVLNSTIDLSLIYANDISAPALPVPLPDAVQATPLIANANCTTSF